jgi:Na+-transporting NADH:ubiquinone oxidoreductase subunit A
MNKDIKNNLFVKEIFKVLGDESCSGKSRAVESSKYAVFDFRGYPFDNLKLMAHEGEWVKVGAPLLHLKERSQMQFSSLAAGKVVKIERGAKRVVQRIVIERSAQQESVTLEPLNEENLTRERFIQHMDQSAASLRVFMRPCKRVVDWSLSFEALFINAAKDLPYALPFSIQAQRHKEAIETALRVLKQFFPVHFISNEELDFGDGVECHRASKNWQASLSSFHIYKINPIISLKQRVLTIDLEDLIYCGYSFLGRWHTKREIYLCGSAVLPESKGLYTIDAGQSADVILKDRVAGKELQIISASALSGINIEASGSLLPSDNVLTVLSNEVVERNLYHLRAIGAGYTASRGYFCRIRNAWNNNQIFGEPRAFIASEYYEHTIPIDIELIALVKALMAKDYERAIFLGLLEVDAEDFALASFVCPSKIQIMNIIRQGQKELLEEHLC